MDESVINGANLFFPRQFGIDPAQSTRNQWLLGLVNAAPYVRPVLSPNTLRKLTRTNIAVLCVLGLLAHRTSEPLSRSSGHNLCHRYAILRGLYLASRDELMGALIRCSLRSGVRHRSKVVYCTCVCGRMFSGRHPWWSGNDVVRLPVPFHT